MVQTTLCMSVHWEGKGLDGIEYLRHIRRTQLSHVPVTHFISAAYFARGGDLSKTIEAMLPVLAPHDEIALNMHPWHSLRGPIECPSRTVITGEDPVLEVEYPGVTRQRDCGFTHLISDYPPATIESYMTTSKLLLRPLLNAAMRQCGIRVDRVLAGVRAGHGMASDDFLACAHRLGFVYDASAMDSSWARAAYEHPQVDDDGQVGSFHPLLGLWADLWGPELGPRVHGGLNKIAGMLEGTGGSGINACTQPICIRNDETGPFVELPLTGGILPPYSPRELASRLHASLTAPGQQERMLSFALRMETAEDSLSGLLDTDLLGSPALRWSTNIDVLRSPKPEPESTGMRGRLSSPWEQCRRQFAGPIPRPSTAPGPTNIEIPNINIPKIHGVHG